MPPRYPPFVWGEMLATRQSRMAIRPVRFHERAEHIYGLVITIAT